jgi:hypothetical protein
MEEKDPLQNPHHRSWIIATVLIAFFVLLGIVIFGGTWFAAGANGGAVIPALLSSLETPSPLFI